MKYLRISKLLFASAAASLIIPAAPALAKPAPQDSKQSSAKSDGSPKKYRDRKARAASRAERKSSNGASESRATRERPRISREQAASAPRPDRASAKRGQEMREQRERVRSAPARVERRAPNRSDDSFDTERFDKRELDGRRVSREDRPKPRADWATRDRSDEWRAEQARKAEREKERREARNRNPYVDGSRWRRDQRDLERRGHWRRDHWRRDHRYDWRGWRKRHNSRFRIGFYFDPFGFRYRQMHLGSYMGWGYLSSRYIIRDPWYYRLPPAYGPYRWVRYFDDAVLVNIYTGQIIDIEYGVFW